MIKQTNNLYINVIIIFLHNFKFGCLVVLLVVCFTTFESLVGYGYRFN